MTDTSELYRLQGIDSEADDKRSRLAEIDALLGQNQEVRQSREVLATKEEEARTARAHMNSLDLDIAGLDEKNADTEQRLYSGAVTNPKELQDMQQEIDSLRNRHQVLDNELLDAMLVLEEREAEVAEARITLEHVEANWSKSQSELVDEKAAITARLLELDEERTRVTKNIAAAALAVYQDLRAKLGGLAVANIKDGACTACGVAPTSSVAQQARHGQLDARCPTCGRILSGG